MKNGCQIVQDSSNILYHEEVCEYRNIICVNDYCEENCVAKNLPNHLEEQHNWTKTTSPEITEDGSKFVLKIDIDFEKMSKTANSRKTFLWIENEAKEHFFVHLEKNMEKQSIMIWVQLYGSNIEAKNYKYSAKVADTIEKKRLRGRNRIFLFSKKFAISKVAMSAVDLKTTRAGKFEPASRRLQTRL